MKDFCKTKIRPKMEGLPPMLVTLSSYFDDYRLLICFPTSKTLLALTVDQYRLIIILEFVQLFLTSKTFFYTLGNLKMNIILKCRRTALEANLILRNNETVHILYPDG